eukprot:m.16459 g.16459  ORF g.16459 m.16459 type:complete len:663 (-) comp11048_c0_seq2:42-2030(-)
MASLFTSTTTPMMMLLVMIVALCYFPHITFASDSNCVSRGSADPSSMLLMYNRIPKCGSTTMTSLIRHYRNHRIVSEVQLGASNQMMMKPFDTSTRWSGGWLRLQQASTDMDRKQIVINHMYYTNFTEHMLPQAMHMQIMREPVARDISEYNYLQYGPRDEGKMKSIQRARQSFTQLDTPPSVNKFIDAYVVKYGDVCRSGEDVAGFVSNTQTKYFCGFHADCDDICSDAALARAKHNLEHEYMFVGTIEDIEYSLQLLEMALPRWFPDIAAHYRDFVQKDTDNKQLRQTNVAADGTHELPTEKTKAHLTSIQSQDVALYAFARDLLFRRVSQCLSDSDGGTNVVTNTARVRKQVRLSKKFSSPETPAPPKCGTKGIKFFKLHKVGSTTAANFMEKYGAAHKLTTCPRTVKLDNLRTCDLTVTHDGSEMLVSSQGERAFFEDVLSHGPMSSLHGSISVVVLRHPYERVLSRFYYDLAKEQGFTVGGVVATKDPTAPTLAPFDDLRFWLKARLASEGTHYLHLAKPRKLSHALTSLKSFDIIGTSERMDALATMLSIKLGCNYTDFLYSSEKVVVGRPTFKDIPEDIQRTIEEGALTDMHVYKAAQLLTTDLERKTPEFDSTYRAFQNELAQAGTANCTFKKDKTFRSRVNVNLPDCFQFKPS